MLARIGVPEAKQRIFQSHSAALEEVKRGSGVALALAFAVSRDLAIGSLVQLPGPLVQGQGTWNIWTLSDHHACPEALELSRFVTTPRATQAIGPGPGTSSDGGTGSGGRRGTGHGAGATGRQLQVRFTAPRCPTLPSELSWRDRSNPGVM